MTLEEQSLAGRPWEPQTGYELGAAAWASWETCFPSFSCRPTSGCAGASTFWRVVAWLSWHTAPGVVASAPAVRCSWGTAVTPGAGWEGHVCIHPDFA